MTTLVIEKRSKQDSLYDLRKEGMVPGILFGGGIKSKMVAMPEKKLRGFVDGAGAVYEVKDDTKKKFVMFDEVQKDPVSNKPIHFSLRILPRGENSTVEVPLIFHSGEQKATDNGLYVTLVNTISVTGEPKDIPSQIDVDLTHLKLGESYTVADLCRDKNLNVEDADDVVLAQYQYVKPVMAETEETLEEVSTTTEQGESIVTS